MGKFIISFCIELAVVSGCARGMERRIVSRFFGWFIIHHSIHCYDLWLLLLLLAMFCTECDDIMLAFITVIEHHQPASKKVVVY